MVAATWHCTFDGVTEGAAVTATSTASGSGDAIPNPLGGGGTGTAFAASATRGAKGIQVVGTANSWFVQHSITPTAGSWANFAVFIKVTSSTSASSAQTIVQFRNSTVVTANFILGTSLTLVTQDSGGSNIKTWNGGAALSPGDYWLWIAAKPGTTTSNGELHAKLRDNTGSLLDSYDSTARNTGTADFTQIRWGKTGAGGNMTLDMDEPQYVLNTSTELDFPTLAVNGNVSAVAARATGAKVNPPTLEGDTTLSGGGSAAASAAASNPPVIGGGGGVDVLPGDSTASMPAPVVQLGQTVTGVAATATATSRVPSITTSAGSSVGAIRMQSTSLAVAPVLHAGQSLVAVKATATATTQLPVVVWQLVIRPTRTIALAHLNPPIADGGVIVHLRYTPSMQSCSLLGYWEDGTIHTVTILGWWDGASLLPLY